MRSAGRRRCRLAAAAMIVAVVAIAVGMKAQRMAEAAWLQNASAGSFDWYLRAGRMIRDRDPVGSIAYDLRGRSEGQSSVEQQQRVVDENAAALQLARRGFDFPARFPASISSADWRAIRDLDRLLLIEAETKAAGGNWGWAANTGLDLVRIGVDIESGEGLAPLVGDEFQRTGQQEVVRCLVHLTGSQCGAVRRRLEHILQGRPSAAAVLQVADRSAESDLNTLLGSPQWRQSVAALDQQGTNLGEWVIAAITGSQPRYPDMMGPTLKRLQSFSREQIRRRYRDYFVQLMVVARTRYSPGARIPRVPSDPVNEVVCLCEEMGYCEYATDSGMNSLLSTALFLQSYHAEYGAYPNRLQDLVPGPAAPGIDGAGGCSPLRYQRTLTGYRLSALVPSEATHRWTTVRTLEIG